MIADPYYYKVFPKFHAHYSFERLPSASICFYCLKKVDNMIYFFPLVVMIRETIYLIDKKIY